MNEEQLAQAIARAMSNKSVGGPWWNKTLFMLGPTAVIALVLVSQTAGILPSPFREDHMRIIRGVETMNYLMRSLCILQLKDSEYANRPSFCNPPTEETGKTTANNYPFFPLAADAKESND